MSQSFAPRFSIFVHVSALPAWLQLDRKRRGEIWETEVAPILGRYPDVSFRYFDAECFTARYSDIMLFETENVDAYTFVIEALRDSSLFSVPYFDLVDIVPTIEEGFRRYEAQKGHS